MTTNTPTTREDRERQPDAAVHQINERQHGGQHPADKLHQARAHQVAHAFHVGHDARHQRARAVLVVIGDGKQAHVALHLPPHFGDKPLAGASKAIA